MTTPLADGTPVRVRDAWPEAQGRVHIRTPHYLRGKHGVVAAYLGSFPNPEDLAFARPARVLPLYHVAFQPRDLWPDSNADEVVVEVFGPWLEPASP